MALLIAGFLLLVLLSLLPQWWVNRVVNKYHQAPSDLPGTADAFLQHLKNRYQLHDLTIDVADPDQGDHYDPGSRTIRLQPRFLSSHSLSAITIAAHEFGHALQHHQQEPSFAKRQVLVKQAQRYQQISGILAIVAPFLGILAHSPLVSILILLAGVLPMLLGVLIHWRTLPVELDASFNKALPILQGGGYLSDTQIKQSRQILKAAAYTYVAGSLRSLLDIIKWMKGIRY